jgi:hypothetical protein
MYVCGENAMNPFEIALSGVLRTNQDYHEALVNVNDTVEFAKKILLNNKVQNFTAADVVKLTELIMLEHKDCRAQRLTQPDDL